MTSTAQLWQSFYKKKSTHAQFFSAFLEQGNGCRVTEIIWFQVKTRERRDIH